MLILYVSQEILQKYTARQLRLAFLTQLWNAKVDFSESLMTGEVKNIESSMNVRSHVQALQVFVVVADVRLWDIVHDRTSSGT